MQPSMTPQRGASYTPFALTPVSMGHLWVFYIPGPRESGSTDDTKTIWADIGHAA